MLIQIIKDLHIFNTTNFGFTRKVIRIVYRLLIYLQTSTYLQTYRCINISHHRNTVIFTKSSKFLEQITALGKKYGFIAFIIFIIYVS